MIVTAFGPFGRFLINPSEVIGREVFGEQLTILPVSYRAVDEFIDSVPATTEAMLMLGVASGSRDIRIERIARFANGDLRDNESACRERSGDDCLHGKLFESIEDPSDCWRESLDAGGYLCNYIFYEATKRLPNTKTGFVHVAPFFAIPKRLQVCRLRRLVSKLKLV